MTARMEIRITDMVWFMKIPDLIEKGRIASAPNNSIDAANSPVNGMGLLCRYSKNG